ncbi:hypothetical protein J1614_009495, partial [Plenodomus biglobosus]
LSAVLSHGRWEDQTSNLGRMLANWWTSGIGQNAQMKKDTYGTILTCDTAGKRAMPEDDGLRYHGYCYSASEGVLVPENWEVKYQRGTIMNAESGMRLPARGDLKHVFDSRNFESTSDNMKSLMTAMAFLAIATLVYSRVISTTASIRQLNIGSTSPFHISASVYAINPPIGNVSIKHDRPNRFPNPPQAAGDWDPNNPAPPYLLEKYARKGGFLRCLLDGTDAAAGTAWDPIGRTPASASSPWRGTLENELRTWYWKTSMYDQEDHCYFGSPSDIGVALEGLGLSIHSRAHGGHNVCYEVEHFEEDKQDDEGDEVPPEDQHYIVAEREYRATGAFYRFGVNPVGGAIIAKNLESPTFSAEYLWEHTPSLDELPALRHGSDIMLAHWLRDNPNPQNLQYYIASNIVNENTIPLLCSILKSKGHQNDPPSWPGVQLDKGELEFDMLLGSPIGATLAFMLVQHKAELGVKHVTNIVIFGTKLGSDSFVLVHMVFKVGNVENPHDVGVAFRSERDGSNAEKSMNSDKYIKGVRTHMLLGNSESDSTESSDQD